MNGIRKLFSRMHGRIREYTAEHGFTCDGCGAELFDYPKTRLCSACEQSLEKNDGKTCPKCGRKTLADGVCLSCKQELPKFTRAITPFVYRGETAGFVNRIKTGTPVLAYYFAEKAVDEFLAKYPQTEEFLAEKGETLLVIPVPLTKERKRERGYNQAELLAEALCRRLRLKGYSAETDTEILTKRRETLQQKHMGRSERIENVAGAYHVTKRKVCRGRTILLIDDILTTGATGSECAARLLSAGADEVIFLVCAALPEQK
jgi:ComF family protein